MELLRTKLPGLLLAQPKVFQDDRGFFFESFQKDRYGALGISGDFIQDNISCSEKGVLRGLHFQNPNTQGKLITVLRGEIFDVAVDLRVNSETFGQWESWILSEENRRQIYVPPGFAHGFLSLKSPSLIHYKCTNYYDPKSEYSLIWNDPDVGIEWPSMDVTLSPKDAKGMRLRDFPKSLLFKSGL